LTCLWYLTFTATVSGCSLMVAPVPRVIAIVVPAMPPSPVRVVPPVPAYPIAPSPLLIEVVRPSDGQSQVRTDKVETRQDKSRPQSDGTPSRNASRAVMVI
jgi:hypothetical protein